MHMIQTIKILNSINDIWPTKNLSSGFLPNKGRTDLLNFGTASANSAKFLGIRPRMNIEDLL